MQSSEDGWLPFFGGFNVSRSAVAVQRKVEAQRRRALAPDYDPVRRDFELALADRMDQEAQALLTPPESLQSGLGGEILPHVQDGLPGLESTLKEPDMLNAEASKQRMHLLERAGALELGVEAAHQVDARNTIEKMAAHQMAAAHKRAMELLAESASANDSDTAIKKARASARLMDAFSRSALTLERLQRGGGQTIQVQYVQVNTMVGDASENMQNPLGRRPKSKGGRPPTTGYRTQTAIAQRQADRDLLREMQLVETSSRP